VPILPEILREQPEASNYDAFVHGWNATTAHKCLQQLLHLNLLKENTQLGLLFSTKVSGSILDLLNKCQVMVKKRFTTRMKV